ncbi:MAG: EAL domain-containing protein [Terracidiphilus sp.]|nr:EAL domain-containing protein [Terracidiphilus sp.]
MIFDENDLHRAFAKDEFYPFFQPQVELRTGQLAGFELLARWRHPRRGIIFPEDFIAIVEKSGRINQLTRQILEKAIATSSMMPSTLRLAVNLTPHQLLDSAFPAKVGTLAERGGFSLDRLTIEITESALLVDLPRAQSVANELKSMHCRLALDDFGTGYSSLKHLQALPFDELKVDRSFVSSMTQSRESRKIVAAVVGLGRSLGLTTVAEGVETQEQANMLLWLGCDFGQGYLYSKPVPAEDLSAIVSRKPQAYSICPSEPADTGPITSLEALPGQRFAQLQAIYDGAPVGLALLDRNLRYVSINRRLAQMNGAPVAAHLGRPITELVPDLYPLFEANLSRALQGESIPNFEVQRPDFEGGKGLRTVLISYQPVRDEAGEVMGVSIAVADISDRKRAEQALRESEEHYRHMVELNPHTPWVMDTQGRTTEVSPRWEKMTGLTAEQALGSGWMDALHPEDRERVKRVMKHAIDSAQPTDVEYRVRRSEGGWRWIRSRGFPRRGPDGEILCWYGSLEDIQEQKETEEALEISQATLQAVADAVPLGMVIAHAPQGTIALINTEAKKVFGSYLQPGQVIADYGQWGATHPDGQPLKPEEYPLAQAFLRGETSCPLLVLFNRKDGTQARATLSAKPIYAHDGRILGGLMLIQNDPPQMH